MSAKDDAFAGVEKVYVEFRDLFAMLPDAAYEEIVDGEWTLAQILAHMAGWYRELAPEFARILAGNATPFSTWSNFDEWNARFTSQVKPGMAALDDYDDAFHVFYAAAKAVPPGAFEPDSDGTLPPMHAPFAGLVIEHTAEHRGPIESWLRGRA